MSENSTLDNILGNILILTQFQSNISLEMAHETTSFFYTWQLVTSVIKITSTAAKSLTSAGNRLGLKAASYFATELFFFGNIMPWAYSELPVLNEAMLCHHLTAPTMKAADILSNYFQRHANILEKGGTSNTWTLFFCMRVHVSEREELHPPHSGFLLYTKGS